MILRLFGWAIVLEFDSKNEVVNSYPARCRFRGFNNNRNNKGYKQITDYLKKNINDLEKDFDE